MSIGTVTASSVSPHAPPVEWSKLLEDAVAKPGVIGEAYSRFWNYSVGNQLLALFQCAQRGLEPGPISTFMGWKECGRAVKKGTKALTLCMPVEVKRRGCRGQKSQPETESATPVERPADGVADADANGGNTDAGAKVPPAMTVTVFVYKPRWFVLCQTDGADYVPASLPLWDELTALRALKIERIPFACTDGNCQGFARDRNVAVSPVAFLPHRTLMHELAHVALGHTAEAVQMVDGDERTPRNVREVEAECVALICCESLGLEGSEFSRGYIQHWAGREAISERSAQRIFKAADQILKAGYPCAEG